MTQGITYMAEELKEEDDKTIFFTREMGSSTLVIIPKDKYKMFETDSTYVLEMVKSNIK